MIAETIRQKLQQAPFVPLVVRASSGVAYKVADPELVVLMKTRLFIAEPKSDRSATAPYLHVAGVEEPANGHRPPRNRRRAGGGDDQASRIRRSAATG